MMRIGLGLSVCDKCGSVVYQPTTTTTTTTPGAASTTLYLTDTIASIYGYDLSEIHDEVSFQSDSGGMEIFGAIQPFNSASWGSFGGEIKVKITGTLTSVGKIDCYLYRVENTLMENPLVTVNLGKVDIGNNVISVPLTNWDDVEEGATPSATDIFLITFFTDDPVETDSFIIDCTNPTDTYLTLDAELDPQPWPAVTTTTTT